MNNYETFRNELSYYCMCHLHDATTDMLESFLSAVDTVMKAYKVEKEITDLITYNGEIPTLVKMFVASKAVEQKSEGTLRNYTIVLSNFFNAVRKSVQDITSNDIRVYFHMYQTSRRVKASTIETMRHVLNSFFAWCHSEEYIPKDPAKSIKALKLDIKEREFLEPVELEMLRESCRNIREKAIIDFLFSTGCRVSEMCNVLKTDIDLDKATVFISKGKGNKSRTTYLNAESRVSLKAYLKTRKDRNPYLFTFERRINNVNGLGKAAVEVLIRKIASRCPQITKKVTPDVMRHTAATMALRNGMPLEQVKEFLGHSNLNTTMIYAKINKDVVRRSHERCF